MQTWDIFISSSIETVKERCQSEIDAKEGQIQELVEEIERGKVELASLKSATLQQIWRCNSS